MIDEKEKNVDSISGHEGSKSSGQGKTFYKSVATGTMSMDVTDREAIDRGWGWAVTMGILMIILGALAIVYPTLTSVGITYLLGAILLGAGIVQLVYAFGVRGWRGFFWHVLIAVTYGVIGVMLLTYSLGGLITLTFLLALYFLISGIFKVVVSLSSRDMSGWRSEEHTS